MNILTAKFISNNKILLNIEGVTSIILKDVTGTYTSDISNLIFNSNLNEEIKLSDYFSHNKRISILLIEVDGEDFYLLNLSYYYNCLLKKVTNLEIENCEIVVHDCSDCAEDIFVLSILLDSVKLNFRDIEGMKIISSKLEEICNSCYNCKEFDFIPTETIGVNLNNYIKGNG